MTQKRLFDIESLYSVIALRLSDVENQISYFWLNNNKKITVFGGMTTYFLKVFNHKKGKKNIQNSVVMILLSQ